MNVIKRDKSNIDFLFLLSLFGVFLVSALFIVLFGAKIYRKTVSGMEENFAKRTAVAYLSEKIQKNDGEQLISAVTIDGLSVLRLSTVTETAEYYTYLYLYDGYLREITQKSTAELYKEDGTPVLALKEFSVTQTGPLFSFHVTDTKNTTTEFSVAVRSTVGRGNDRYE